MKNKFNDDRISEWKIQNKDGEIPIFCVKPLNQNTKKAIIFITGLNGNGFTTYYWNYPVFDNSYLISFDGRAQGGNTSKPSRFYKTYLKDIDIIVDDIKNRLNVDEIYLMGESWGSSLAVLYKKYYPNKVNGVIIWNMPYKIKNISKKEEGNKLRRNLCMLATFLFSINTYDEAPFVEELTNNKLLLRTVKLLRNNKLSNKVILASWRSFKPSWKFLFKNSEKLEKLNINYIQSKQDIMAEMPIVEKLAAKTKNVIIFEKGYHILTFDENVNYKLFDIISNIVNNVKVGK